LRMGAGAGRRVEPGGKAICRRRDGRQPRAPLARWSRRVTMLHDGLRGVVFLQISRKGLERSRGSETRAGLRTTVLPGGEGRGRFFQASIEEWKNFPGMIWPDGDSAGFVSQEILDNSGFAPSRRGGRSGRATRRNCRCHEIRGLGLPLSRVRGTPRRAECFGFWRARA